MLFVACSVASPLIVAHLLHQPLEELRVRWHGPERAVVGEQVHQDLQVTNASRRPLGACTLTLHLDGYADLRVSVPPLAPGDGARARLVRTARRRSWTDGQLVVLTTSVPFGMIRRTRRLRLPVTAVVHPAPRDPMTEPARGGDGGDHPAGSPARTGFEVHSTRHFRPGDSLRRVHWRSTARTGSLIVVEPERAVNRRLALLVTGEASSEGWEGMLARAAATAVAAAGQGREIMLWADDPRADPLCSTHAVDLLDWFSMLLSPRPATPQDVAQCARWAGPGGDVVIAGTGTFPVPPWPAVDPDLLHAVGCRLALLTATPQDDTAPLQGLDELGDLRSGEREA